MVVIEYFQAFTVPNLSTILMSITVVTGKFAFLSNCGSKMFNSHYGAVCSGRGCIKQCCDWSIYLSHASSSKTVHFMAVLTVEH